MNNRKKWSNLINLLLMPAVLAVLGLVLLCNPDAASILIAKVLGWCLVAAGAVSAIVTVAGWPLKRVSRIITTAVLLALGGWLLSNPLALAENLGKLAGLVLIIQGGRGLWEAWKLAGAARAFKSNFWLALATLAVGAFLFVFPMTTSRVVFRLCGVVLVVLGAVNLITRLRTYQRLEGPDDPNIIDAAE